MAQTPKGRLVKGPYEPVCRDCAIYFSSTVQGFVFFFAVCTLFQLALDIILGPRFATMHVTPGFAIIFQKSLKEKVKENNY